MNTPVRFLDKAEELNQLWADGKQDDVLAQTLDEIAWPDAEFKILWPDLSLEITKTLRHKGCSKAPLSRAEQREQDLADYEAFWDSVFQDWWRKRKTKRQYSLPTHLRKMITNKNSRDYTLPPEQFIENLLIAEESWWASWEEHHANASVETVWKSFQETGITVGGGDLLRKATSLDGRAGRTAAQWVAFFAPFRKAKDEAKTLKMEAQAQAAKVRETEQAAKDKKAAEFKSWKDSLLPTPQIAEYAQCSVATVQAEIRRNKLPGALKVPFKKDKMNLMATLCEPEAVRQWGRLRGVPEDRLLPMTKTQQWAKEKRERDRKNIIRDQIVAVIPGGTWIFDDLSVPLDLTHAPLRQIWPWPWLQYWLAHPGAYDTDVKRWERDAEQAIAAVVAAWPEDLQQQWATHPKPGDTSAIDASHKATTPDQVKHLWRTWSQDWIQRFKEVHRIV